MKLWIWFLIGILVMTGTVHAIDVCDNEQEVNVACMAITPSIDCSTYDQYNSTDDLEVDDGAMDELATGTGVYNFTFNEGDLGTHTIILCDNTTAIIDVRATVRNTTLNILANQSTLYDRINATYNATQDILTNQSSLLRETQGISILIATPDIEYPDKTWSAIIAVSYNNGTVVAPDTLTLTIYDPAESVEITVNIGSMTNPSPGVYIAEWSVSASQTTGHYTAEVNASLDGFNATAVGTTRIAQSGPQDVTVEALNSPVNPRNNLDFRIDVNNTGEIDQESTIDYWVENLTGYTISSGQRTRLIPANGSISENWDLLIPDGTSNGTYLIRVNSTYDSARPPATSSDTFVVEVIGLIFGPSSPSFPPALDDNITEEVIIESEPTIEDIKEEYDLMVIGLPTVVAKLKDIGISTPKTLYLASEWWLFRWWYIFLILGILCMVVYVVIKREKVTSRLKELEEEEKKKKKRIRKDEKIIRTKRDILHGKNKIVIKKKGESTPKLGK